ncbi:AAA family ATPase [Methylobacterium sp. WL103]|uniref:AAA family ATPase n=1 Tax=Methylobacterium sp. WL103 TaxID=2603891 RepID=UPI0011CB49D1|nr:AAA family ATPase [Methylobacterium sp. WL103]TXN05318.1 AAA family ATPase [Methylobacterium sp. WL103]
MDSSIHAPADAAQLGDLLGGHINGHAAAVCANPFLKWWDLGYRSLVPIVPPGAPLAPKSSLALKLAGGRDDRGKAPGVRRDDNQWCGLYGWQQLETTEADLDRWNAMGAGVGLADDGGLVLLDIDANDEATADAIEADALAMLGPAPCRVGGWPKRLLLYRTEDVLSFTALTFQGPSDKPDRIELLAKPKQAVVEGIYARTGRPYAWRRPIVARGALILVTRQQLDAFFAMQREKLPAAMQEQGATLTDRENVDQQALKGDVAQLRKAVALIPNTAALFPSYRSMITMGEAIHSACADDAEAGREIWHEWASRWEGDDYDFDVSDQRWETFKAPHGVGAGWLFYQAEKHAPDRFSRGELWFDASAAEQSFPAGKEGETAAPSVDADVFEMLTLGDIISRPPLRFIVGRHLPEHSVGFLYGDPGSGKSFIALDWALHLAFGLRDWHGDPITADPTACVIYLAGEGSHGFRARALAWAKRHGIPESALDDGRFRLLPVGVNMMQPEQVAKLARTIKLGVGRASLVVTDTVSRAMPGADENTQKEMTLFVKACDVLRDTFDCVVLGVHHANRAGGMRGSSVLSGAGDFVFKLERAKGAPVGRLICEKQKDGPDGWEDPYRFDLVYVEGGSSLVPSRHMVAEIPAPKASEPTAAPDLSVRVLEAMRTAWASGKPWGATYRAKDRWAAKLMASDFGFTVDGAEELLRYWITVGQIELRTVDTHSKRSGYCVLTYTKPGNDLFQ